MKKILYNGGSRGYIKNITNNEIVRLKKAKKELKSYIPKIMLSLGTTLVGASLISAGIAINVNSNNANNVEAISETYYSEYSPLSYETLNLDDSEKSYSADSFYSNIMLGFGGVTTLAGIVAMWKYICEYKATKEMFNDKLEIFFQIILFEPEFIDFLKKYSISQEEFLSLDLNTRSKIVDNFVEALETTKNMNFEEMSN